MVCKHKSEWSYGWEKIKSDYEKFIEYHYPKAKQEYIDECLKEIKAKYNALYDFWNKLEFKTDTFWYFEPFAWVEQMKRVFDGFCPDDCSQCFDYQDVVTNPHLNNQSDNVNKNRFQREKRYNKTYPYPQGYYHSGTDILASSGDEVYAMLCGEVYSVVNTFKPNEYKANSLGNYLVIKSKDKEERVIYLQYCHLDEVLVKKGQKIKHGEVIGKAGSTGNAASVYDEKGKLIHGIYPQYRHIHIEAFLEVFSKKNRIDPEQFMKTKFDETTKGNVIK